MITLAFGWLLILLPLPLLVMRYWPVFRQQRLSLRVPRLQRLAGLAERDPHAEAVVIQRSTVNWTVLWLIWAATLLAVSRPQYVSDPITRTIPSRDLLLAVDLSASMNTQDFVDSDGKQADRLTACKQVLGEFLQRRDGDRVSLIFFGSAPFVQAPFTEDLQVCRQLLDEAQVGMAGPKTVIGDAIGLALNLFTRSEQEQRVLILLTDGNDTGSKVTPQQAARIAKQKDVTIHTVAVGDPAAVGEEKIDEDVLQAMAKETGGQFYRADDRQQLEDIYRQLDQVESSGLESVSFRPKSELFHWPLALAFLLGLSWHGFQAFQYLLSLGSFVVNRRRHNAVAALVVLLPLIVSGAAPEDGVWAVTRFRLIRPAWLLALIPVALILGAMLHRRQATTGLENWIDSHLLTHLLVTPPSRKNIGPWHLLSAAWLVTTLSLCGPTWQREPSPFADDQAAVVFVMEITPSMLAQDVQPSRLQRAVQKLHDLLDLRRGADSALIAYAGSIIWSCL